MMVCATYGCYAGGHTTITLFLDDYLARQVTACISDTAISLHSRVLGSYNNNLNLRISLAS
jgi:hypothetical protein